MPLWVSPTSQPTAGLPCCPKVSSQVADDLEPHLVLEPGDEDAVALARLPGLGIEHGTSGTRNRRQSLGARARALGAGEHHVHDVLEQVVAVAVGDEPFDAVEVPGAVGLLDRLGAAGADVGARVGFGEHHGGAPVALDRHRAPSAFAARCRCRRGSRPALGPARYMNAAGCAPRTNSLIAHATIDGAGTPPTSSGRPMRNHSPCCHARNDFLNGSGRVTAWVSGSNVGGLRSLSAKDSASGPSACCAASLEHLAERFAVEITELHRRPAPSPGPASRRG